MLKILKILKIKSISIIEQKALLAFGNSRHIRRPIEVKGAKKTVGTSLIKGKTTSKVKSKTLTSRKKRSGNRNKIRSMEKNSKRKS